MSEQAKVKVTIKATYNGLETVFEFQSGSAIEQTQSMVDKLLAAGYKAPEPIVINAGGGFRGGGNQGSKFVIDAEKNRLFLFPNYMLTKDDKGEAFKAKVKEIAGATPYFWHKDAEKNPYKKYCYSVGLNVAHLLYADEYFSKWEKPELPEGFRGESDNG